MYLAPCQAYMMEPVLCLFIYLFVYFQWRAQKYTFSRYPFLKVSREPVICFPDILLITDRIDVGRRSCRNPTYVLSRQPPPSLLGATTCLKHSTKCECFQRLNFLFNTPVFYWNQRNFDKALTLSFLKVFSLKTFLFSMKHTYLLTTKFMGKKVKVF